MLIEKPKLSVEEYKFDDIKKIVNGTAACADCKFCLIWKGAKPVTFPKQDVYRMYCTVNREYDATLPDIFKTGDVWMKWKTVKGILSWIPSILRVKELKKCPVDLASQKKLFHKKLETEEEEILKNWRGKRKIF